MELGLILLTSSPDHHLLLANLPTPLIGPEASGPIGTSQNLQFCKRKRRYYEILPEIDQKILKRKR